MNEEYPPLDLPQPEFAPRRPERPRVVPIPPEFIQRREEIARVLGVKVEGLTKSLRRMSADERKAIFYKLEHEGPVKLDGTGLKPITTPTRHTTLAVPREDNLDKLGTKLGEFGTGELRRGNPPHAALGLITDIEPGKPTDRLSDELFADYENLIKQPYVICEIEIISLLVGKRKQRAEIAVTLERLNQVFASGVHGTLFEHEEIKGTCRAVIRTTGKMFQTLVEEREWQTRISWFEPKPRFQTFQTVWNEFSIATLGPLSPPEAQAATVCIVDSGITAGNPFLAPVAREDLFRSFLRGAPENPYDEHGHGSAVASLVSYYALNLEKGAENEAHVWVASARILNADNQMEDERLFSRVLTEVVETFVPLGVRIFNLSVSNLAKKWNTATRRTIPRRSWVARTIDRLSWEHDVVFVACTGNIPFRQVADYLRAGRPYPEYLADEEARILDPGQAALALTVGSLVPGTLVVFTPVTALAERYQPSPFTRCGPGIRQEIKPELVDYGGNYIADATGAQVRGNMGTDVVAASHQLTPALALNRGTSYSAPRVAHKLARVEHELRTLGIEHVTGPLLKAFLVNSAAVPAETRQGGVRDRLSAVDPKLWDNTVGYGLADHGRATYCDDHSVILFYQGEIPPNEVAFFDVPVPDVLAGTSGLKRITTTVTFYPQVQRWGLEAYLGTTLKWRMYRGNVERERVVAAMSRDEDEPDAGNGSDDHDQSAEAEIERPGELKFQRGVTLRSRGTVQHDVYEWNQHRAEYSENHYTLAVAAYERWGRSQPAAVPFAVVVRMEDVAQAAEIYAAVQRILAEIEIQAQANR